MIKNLTIDNISDVLKFFAYFEQNYVGLFDETGENLEKSRYQIEFWNVFSRVGKI
jgi:hypothetical protein